MMQTVVDTIDAPTCRANSRKHCALKRLQHFRLQVPLSDSGLIRNYCDAQSEIIQQPDRFRNPGEQLELRPSERRVDHTCILVIDQSIDYAIPIEKNGLHLKKAPP